LSPFKDLKFANYEVQEKLKICPHNCLLSLEKGRGLELWEMWCRRNSIFVLTLVSSILRGVGASNSGRCGAGEQLACCSQEAQLTLLTGISSGQGGGLSVAATQRLQSPLLPFKSATFLSEGSLAAGGFDGAPFLFQRGEDGMWSIAQVHIRSERPCAFLSAVFVPLNVTRIKVGAVVKLVWRSRNVRWESRKGSTIWY
jgi:hypothetical protein